MKRIFFIICLLLLPLWGLFAQNFDINLLKKLNAPDPTEAHFWLGVSNSVYWVPPAYILSNLAYGLATDDRQAYRYSLEGTLSAAFATIISEAIKVSVNRPRPTQTYPDLIRTYSFTDAQSFPSGHATLAFATATSMAYQGKKWYISIPVFTWSLSGAYSRMRLGKHYPTDVLAGTVIGIGGGILGHYVAEKILE